MLFLLLMHPDLLPLIGRPYNFEHSPGVNPDSEAINCQLAIHLAYKNRFGITLPPGMWSKEIHEDRLIFQTIEKYKHEGDIAIFGPFSQTDARYFHLAYYLDNNEFLHANFVDRLVSVWTLEKILAAPRYAELKRVKRLKPELFDTQLRPFISAG